MSEDKLQAFIEKIKRMKTFDPDRDLPDRLVVHADEALWIGEEITGNPSRIGVLMDIPTRTMEFFLQEIPPGKSSDLQRHAHESIHFVMEGEGYSEIGEETVPWKAGSFIYTPPWAWHRHYNTGTTTVRMLLIENSRLLDCLNLNRRESAGLISYAEFNKKQEKTP